MGAPKPDATPQVARRQARKQYLCDAPDGGTCYRKILKGHPYTQITYPPFQPPFATCATWTVIRACTTCRPIPASELHSPEPCTFGSDLGDCHLPAGHLQDGRDHEFSLGLF